MGIIKIGDTMTIGGMHRMVRNPDRRWWQVWKPRMVAGPDLQAFTIAAVGEVQRVPDLVLDALAKRHVG